MALDDSSQLVLDIRLLLELALTLLDRSNDALMIYISQYTYVSVAVRMITTAKTSNEQSHLKMYACFTCNLGVTFPEHLRVSLDLSQRLALNIVGNISQRVATKLLACLVECDKITLTPVLETLLKKKSVARTALESTSTPQKMYSQHQYDPKKRTSSRSLSFSAISSSVNCSEVSIKACSCC